MGVVIAGAKRTPMGGFQGELGAVSAPDLGGVAIQAAIDDAGVSPEAVDEVLMGIVLPAGVGQAPARQAAFAAGLAKEVPATAVSKVCGSGMRSMIQAYDQILARSSRIVVAGGMESMTRAPYLSPESRGGARLGHRQLVDHMFFDGLEDAYDKGRLMGTFAEDCARKYQFTREAQDEYAIASLAAANRAQAEGDFASEIAPVSVKSRRAEVVVESDEQPRNARPDKIPTLKPAFAPDGTVTAANASSISDGAAALVIADEAAVASAGVKARAHIVGHAGHAQEPGWFTTAPVPAAQKLLAKIGWNADDVDLWEVNEAFAVVAMAFASELGVPREKLNVNGGACALGHPIGASGARIVVTLLNALERRNLSRGVAAICIGGGEGLAIAVERR